MPNLETADEKILMNELRLLIKQANQRILRLERLTGIKEGFASKQLLDYLSSTPIDAITKSGRISFKKDYTVMQQKAIIKAIKDFKQKEESTLKGIKSYVQKYSNIAGKKISYEMASTYYQVVHDLSWLYDGNMTESVFWRDFAPLVKSEPKDEWVELVGVYKEQIPDRLIKRNLEMLYDYLKNG